MEMNLSKYLVFSGNWELEVSAQDALNAALIATKQAYTSMKDDFSIAESVVVVKQNQVFKLVEAYPSIAIFEDLGMYSTAAVLRKVLKRK